MSDGVTISLNAMKSFSPDARLMPYIRELCFRNPAHFSYHIWRYTVNTTIYTNTPPFTPCIYRGQTNIYIIGPSMRFAEKKCIGLGSKFVDTQERTELLLTQ